MKVRIDSLLFNKGFAKSRSRAVALIEAGFVVAGGKAISKPSEKVEETADITLSGNLPFVSRGGEKLLHALTFFKIDVAEKTALDIGSSTGGFTDCLLKGGAKKVFCVDVGTDQLDPDIRNSAQVIVMEKTDIRNVATLPEAIDITVIDVSFISLSLILPEAKRLTKKGGDIIVLVKPQFEVGKGGLSRGGLVKDPELHKSILVKIKNEAEKLGLTVLGETTSPLIGGSGNVEFLLHLK